MSATLLLAVGAALWLVVAFAVAIGYGRAVRRADERLAERIRDVSR